MSRMTKNKLKIFIMKNLKKLTRQQMQIVNGGINCVWDTGYCPGNTVCQAPPGLSDYSSYRCR